VLKAYPFPAWEPDKLTPGTLSVAKNVLPIANGYAPMKGFEAITGRIGSAGEAFSGGGAFIDSTGISTLLAATPTRLRKYASGAWTTLVSLATDGRWSLAQFGDNVLCANGGPLRSIELSSGADSIPTDAPNALSVAQVRDFVMCLTDENTWRWSQFNNSSAWTTGVNQADEQPILSGSGIAIVGGEYGIGLRTNGIDRISYVGGDIVFQFDEVSAEVGCLCAGSAVNVGKLIFFLSERGFEMCDGASVRPISDEKVRSWWFGRFSRQDMQDMWAAVDPRNSEVKWAMPGTPGVMLTYNWVLDRFSYAEMDIGGVFTGFTAYTSIDEIDALYPSGLDSVDVSLDSSLFAGGNPLLLVVNADSEVGALTGPNLEATLVLSDVEPVPGRRARIRALRPISNALNASAQINARMRRGDGENVISTGTMRTNGKMPVRSNGRYNDITMIIPAGELWTDIQGVECEFEPGDGR
jgi:hypothetical protein